MEKVQEQSLKSAEETDNLEYSKRITVTPVDGTPFTIINGELGAFIAIGNQRITDVDENKGEEELLEEIKNKDWDLITKTIGVIIELYTKSKQN